MRRAWTWLGKLLLLGAAMALLTAGPLLVWRPLWVAWGQQRARQLFDARKSDQALAALQTALRWSPENATTHWLLARAHRRLGNFDKAIRLLRRAEKFGADAQRVQREQWLLLAQAGRMREAEPHLGELLTDSQGEGPEICEAYVKGYFANLRPAEAERLLDAWQQDYPQDPRPHFMRGYLCQAMMLRPEAVAAYREGLALAPGETVMRCRLAQTLVDLREFDEAKALLERCLQEDPGNTEVRMAWAVWLSKSSEPERSGEVLRQLLEDQPDCFEARRLLGETELSLGRLEAALACLEAAAKQRPYDTTTRYALGKALRALGRADEAKPHFDYVHEAERSVARMERQLRSVFGRPDDAGLRYEIGITLLRYGAPEDGAKWLRTVLQLDPEHPGAHRALAEYCEAQGDWQNARFHREHCRGP